MDRGWEWALLVVLVLSVVPLAFLSVTIGPTVFLVLGPVALVTFVVYRRARQRRLDPQIEPAQRRKLRVGPMPVPDDSMLRDVPQPMSACPECGYLGIRMPGIGDGLWPGGGELGGRMVCSRCDWQGLPLRFDTREDYAEFLRELQPASPS